MTLHEVIIEVLKDEKEPLNPQAIAAIINNNGKYKRKDGQPLTQFQIKARVAKYNQIFDLTKDDFISLVDPVVRDLERYVSEIKDLLYTTAVITNQSEIALVISVLILAMKEGGLIDKNHDSYNGLPTTQEAGDGYKALLIALYQLDEKSKFKGCISEAIHLIERCPPGIKKNIYDATIWHYRVMIEHGISDKEFGIFFTKLVNEFSWGDRQISLTSTPQPIIKLLEKIVRLRDNDILFDPFIGRGALITSIIGYNNKKNITVLGGDIIKQNVILSKINLLLNGIESLDLREGNAYSEWNRENNFADWYISNPPFNSKVQLPYESFLLKFNTKDGNVINILEALAKTKLGGKAAIIISESFMFLKSTLGLAVKKGLIKDNHLEGVISLPSGIFAPYSNVKTNIVLLNKKKDHSNVFFYDASKVLIKNFDSEILKIEKAYFTPDCDEWKLLTPEIFEKNSYDFSTLRNAPKNIPDDSSVFLLKDLIETSFSGKNVDKYNLNETQGMPFIQIGDLSKGAGNFKIDDYDIKHFVSDLELISNPKFISSGYVLLAKYGNKLKPTIYTGKKALCSSGVLALKPNAFLASPEYIVGEFEKEYVQSQTAATKISSTIPSINTRALLHIQLRLPSLSEQKRIVANISNKLAEESNQLGYFIGELKHKIKGPLGALDTGIQTLRAYLERKAFSKEAISFDDITVKTFPGDRLEDLAQYSLNELLKRISEGVKRIDENMNKADLYARLGADDITISNLNIYEIFSESIIPNYRGRVNIKLKARRRNLFIKGDLELIKIIVENFIENAIVHGFGNDPQEEDQIMISFIDKKEESKGNKIVYITIENNGTPLPPHFSKDFFVSDGKTTDTINGGSGIGGALIAKALERMNGEIIEIVDNSNTLDVFKTKFIFSLPAFM